MAFWLLRLPECPADLAGLAAADAPPTSMKWLYFARCSLFRLGPTHPNVLASVVGSTHCVVKEYSASGEDLLEPVVRRCSCW